MSQTFMKNIEKMQRNLEEIGETPELRFDELFNEEFLSQCSTFVSLDDMLEKSGFKVETAEDFKAIPDDEWERFIVENTSYESWREMQMDAGAKLLEKRLYQGLK
ncbi:hypothetical protein [Serratia proteamaculans]|uniref:hypothetical protein n=1 Tax=Serratia proteamaculans TaxID=28151 RepID=UPI002183CCFD|nr:hypothetical protein [Serratia proteamaculans]CAI2439073.1 Uncharacterised protein [Serratia proteamaculans]